ncbi:MAG TPA: hypothetical protein PLG77_07975 [Burkholderiaceae bacterium]|nr:hypothetical protein [Burkholderiaceae bacterium]
MQAPYYPIIYVRGYAMTEGERDETASDPFCGFNVGSTVYRAAVDRNAPPKRFIFESPVLRLGSDFGYSDVYEHGTDIMDADWQPRSGNAGIAARSVVVYRYYDAGSTLFGDGKASSIETYARGLDTLILRVRDLVCAQEAALEAALEDAQRAAQKVAQEAAPEAVLGEAQKKVLEAKQKAEQADVRGGAVTPENFRCYLVAHSMGGLVVRAFLSNPALGSATARGLVDKVFTYATPHNGIDIAGINVPSWLSASDMNNFNRDRMAGYLLLDSALKKYGRVDYMRESAFPIDRMFCMVGSNRSDYDAGKGLSRAFVGQGSDGLVKIANASVWGLDAQDKVTGTAATAYCYRSHSGFYGIVNSEEAYQNLTRFLFGDIRVEIWLEVDEVRLPAEIERDDVDALYQFELLARPRGKRWLLSRRIAEEDSPACRTHKQLTTQGAAGAKNVYLSTVFLANRARISNNPDDRTLSYSMDVRVRVPDYEKNNTFWPNHHYEGSYLFRDSLIVTMEPPQAAGDEWAVKYGWESNRVGVATRTLKPAALIGNKLRLEVDLPATTSKPGIAGKVVLIASAWN